ncbi:transposase [Paraburkholderia sp. MM5477-R1]|uniref:transposase n=1 Tax=Paraburkholderia sp. MM5477-R1 TaxID=2991062 RepID=UPI003D20D359
MGKHRTPYPAEFRAQTVELVKAGRRPEELEKEFEPTAQTIYNWVAQADRSGAVSSDSQIEFISGSAGVIKLPI